MEAIGAEVMVMSADVGHPRQMHQVMDAIQTRFDQLHGVIHAAGAPGGGIIQLKTRGEAERVMAPKVAGALALDEALADLDLEIFVSGAVFVAGVGAGGARGKSITARPTRFSMRLLTRTPASGALLRSTGTVGER